ncbi:hypothetical protein IV203_031140 [Nitzschia inconspicua]|uniref:Uncharacterized protein n=1 Tax=Nitzschia inconspicua TaxID=303405 RepID=A0A9K3Q233_9STRA|nr:hypothetical protein IV203_031140 [Nitzschia inconspicua]
MIFPPSTTRRSPSFRLFQDYKDDNNGGTEDEDNFFYDDFDFVIGEGNDQNSKDSLVPTTPLAINTFADGSKILQDRMTQLAETEQAAQQQIADNWKEGYWNVWGCSLDPFVIIEGNEESEEHTAKTVVTCLRLASTVENEEEEESTVLVVGRSDGSLVWLKMDTSISPSLSSYDTAKMTQGRSTVTYFENKLTAKATQDGGMTVGAELQRSGSSFNDSQDEESSPPPPFDILAQLTTGSKDSIIDMLVLPESDMLWTIKQDTPHIIQTWRLLCDKDTGFLLPASKTQTSKNLNVIHSSPIVSMKQIPGHNNLVLSISEDGQAVVWMVDTSNECVSVRFEGNLFDGLGDGEAFYSGDVVLSMDVDEELLFVGARSGGIFVYSLSSILHEMQDSTRGHLLVKQFVGFSNRHPGVSALCIASPGTLVQKDDQGRINAGRPPTKTLIAGNVLGELKQWELIPTRNGNGLEYWPRMASQKLPGKAHVFDTNESTMSAHAQSMAIRQVLVIQNVILAATDCDLRFWDPATGKGLYDMQGLDFAAGCVVTHPSLVVAKDSVLVTNGMDQYVCVHDFSMERITSENAHDMIQKDDHE